MIRAFLLILAMSVPFLAFAGEGDFWVDVNVASYHSGSDGYYHNGKYEDFNQVNLGLGLSYEMDSLIEWTGGFYRNSYDENSLYGGLKFKHDFHVADVDITPGLTVGFVTGYEDYVDEASAIQIMALPSIGVSFERVRAVIGVVPVSLVSSSSDVGVIYTFQAGIRF